MAVGGNSLDANTTGANNTACGYQALSANTDGESNVAVGTYSLDANTSGMFNTVVGRDAGRGISTGLRNTLMGSYTMDSANANDNTGVGYACLTNISAGANTNTCLGSSAGYNVSTGTNNLLLGYNAGTSSSPAGVVNNESDTICLGDNNIASFFCADTSISSSDSRDKTDINDFTKGLDWIKALRPITYRWDRRTWYGTEEAPYGTPDGSKKKSKLHIGFLAQEALEVEKENGYGSSNDDSLVVNLTPDGMSYGMKYERLVPVLVNAIKELSAEVEQLKSQLNN